jgi:type II secretory pathway pseudopilin PulG
MHNTKQAFSFVEIIITISIIVLLAVIWLSANQGYKDKSDNTKIISDVETINNALESYVSENNSLPMPWWNINFFEIDTSYAHSYTGTTTFWVYGSVTENTLAKKYLDVLPLDPRTNNYYSYWKTKGTEKIVANQFEIASVQLIDWEYQAKVSWNYTAEAWPYNLIREYNGSNFVYDKSKSNLPYNPEELILTATANGIVYRENDTIEATSWDLEIFFSDGSVSVLENGWKLKLTKLSFPNENNLNTLVKLSLWAWTIWTKATHLNNKSEFEVYTTDSTAAVRGTIFWVKKDSLTTPTEVFVVDWEVEVYKNDEEKTKIIDLTKDESVKVLEWQNEGTATLQNIDYTNIENNFIVWEDIRGAETVAMINQEATATADTGVVNTPVNTSCILDWITIVNWESYNFSIENSVTAPATCHYEERTCDNWILSWHDTYVYSNCEVVTPNDCIWWDRLMSWNTYTYNAILNWATWNANYIETITWWNITHSYELSCNDWTINFLSQLTPITTCTDANSTYNSSLNACEADCTFIVDWVEMCNEELAWMSLFAYAPYNTDLNLHTNSTPTPNIPFYQNIDVCSPYSVSNSLDSQSSICTNWTENWILVENFNNDNDDVLKYTFSDYEKLTANWSFAIEMNVKVPTDTNKHYLIHSWNNIKLYTQYFSWKQRLYLNPTSSTDYIDLSAWEFNKIILENNSGVMTARKELWATTTSKNLSNNIDFLYVWAFEYWLNDYRWQFNEIIDYVKIYKN